MYLSIKILHISCAVISISGFIFRSILIFRASSYTQKRWIKVSPHVIDTVLLGSAVYLAINSQQYPIANTWLTAKIIGLLLYISFGMVVMRFSTNLRYQLFGFAMALLSFTYIVSVALTRDPLPWI
ncbi:MAG: putative membrane protein SirB2 [Oceanicoccus sp.]|jgi:uncharacterized membrane protein SirB2